MGETVQMEATVQIETTNKYVGLNGGREVWVRVYSDEVLDWPKVEARLSQGQRDMLDHLGRRTVSYFPHHPTAEEQAEHGHIFEDWWVWAATSKRKAR